MNSTAESNRLASYAQHIAIKQYTSKVKHGRPDIMLKYFLVLKVLLRLINYDVIGAIKKAIIEKTVNHFINN